MYTKKVLPKDGHHRKIGRTPWDHKISMFKWKNMIFVGLEISRYL